jgi:hypothetical protein
VANETVHDHTVDHPGERQLVHQNDLGDFAYRLVRCGVQRPKDPPNLNLAPSAPSKCAFTLNPA